MKLDLPFCLALLSLAACSSLPFGSSSDSSDDAVDPFELWLSERLDALIEAGPAPGVAVSILTPERELHLARGFADEANDVPMTAETPVRIASNTKTFVAATALVLAERGELDLDAGIGPLLPPEWTALLEADGYPTAEITLRHLLSHTAGLAEHVRTPTFNNRIAFGTAHEWTADEQVRLAVDEAEPVAAPGARFEYSDTGYVLLGTILERTQSKPLAELVRDELRFWRLGLRDTWWELVEEAPPQTALRAHQFVGGRDTHDWHPSLDLFGGGGLVSTSSDLALFFDRLFEGRVFDEHGTLSEMLSPEHLPVGSPYRLGMFAERMAGETAWQHSGFWGTYAARVPALETSIAIVVTDQASFGRARQLVHEIVAWLEAPPMPTDPSETVTTAAP